MEEEDEEDFVLVGLDLMVGVVGVGVFLIGVGVLVGVVVLLN